MDANRLAMADTSTALRRAEWECFAVELRAKANAMIEALIDDKDEIETRQMWLDLAMTNPVDRQFEVDTELYDAAEADDDPEGTRGDSALRSLDDDLDSSRD